MMVSFGKSHSSNDQMTAPRKIRRSFLDPVRQLLSSFEVHDPQIARLLCKIIPANCPFERDIKFFGHLLFHVPAMCKINPLYDQFMELRFRALIFLADECGEDVTQYCQ
jgi:hypothetical protein